MARLSKQSRQQSRKYRKQEPTRQQKRYDLLIEDHFTPLEARALSVLAKNTPALRLLRSDRVARWDRFMKIAVRKQSRNQWQPQAISEKWTKNLARLYRARRWRVQYGGEGTQQDMKKGSPNPWAMYRDYERRVGGPKTKGYTSPWELRLVKKGKTVLDKRLILIKRAERKGEQVPRSQVRDWIEKLDIAIRGARGSRRAQLVAQRNNLRRAL